MFEVVITRKDIESIHNYMENKGLITHMNNAGLSIGAMTLIINAIANECDKVLNEINKESE